MTQHSSVDEHGNIMMVKEDEGVAFARLCARKGALKLELAGMTRRGQTAYSICKQVYGLKGSRQSVYDQMQKLVDDAIAEKR